MEEKRLRYNPLDSGKMYAYALMCSLVLSFVISLVLMGVAAARGDDATILSTNIWFQFCYSALLYAVVFSVFLVFNKKNNIDFKTATTINKKPNLKTIIICFCLGLVFVLLTSPIINCYTFLLDYVGVSMPNDITLNSGLEFLASIIVVALLPAIVEELLYRGVILNGLRRLGKWRAVLISAAAFSLMHGNLYQLPYTFAFGIVLGLIAFETRSILPTMIVHFVSNAQVLIFAYFKIGESSVTISLGYFGIAIAFTIVAVLVAVFAIYLIRKANKAEIDKKDDINEDVLPNGLIITKERKDAERLASIKIWIIAFTVAAIMILLNMF